MSDEAALVAETRAWFQKARLDLDAAEWDLAAMKPFTAHAVFLCQQAVEKSLKGFLTWHGKTFRKTHNLVELGAECSRIDPGLESLLRRAAALTEYAWRFRYPGEPRDPDMEESREAVALARLVHETLVMGLPTEARPR